MRRNLKLCLLLAGMALVVGLVPAPSQADHAWANYHWERSDNPAQLTIGDNMTAIWDPHLDTAIADWNQSSVLSLTEVAGKAKGGNCRPSNGKIEVCNDEYGFNGWLGIAQIWVDGDHIIRANSRMNDSYYNTPTYDTSEWRLFVVCQEIGHDFGLGHQDEDFNNSNLGSCMDYTSDPISNQHPNQHDYDQLEAIYAHLDSDGGGSGCNPRSPRCNGSLPAPPAFDLAPTHPSDFGRLVSVSPDRGQAVFELDFGNGKKILTHVTWTLEVAARLASH